MTNWETDLRGIGECLAAWEKQHGLGEEDAAMELRLTKQTYRRIKHEQHLVSDYGENLLRDIAALFDGAEIDMNEVNFVRDGQMMMRFELDMIRWK